MTPETLISDAALAAYRSDGVMVARGAFGRHWIELAARGVERNLAEPSPLHKVHTPPGGGGRFFGDIANWKRIGEFRTFAVESPAAAIAARVMPSKSVQFFHDHVLVKEPGTTEVTPWHHDLPYYCVQGDLVVSIWMPLDPVPAAVCPRFVAGSHRWGRLFYPRYFSDGHRNYDHLGDRYEPVPDIDAQPGDYDLRFWDLEPGDAILFHFLTVHGAPGNSGTVRRRAFSTRWLGDDVTYVQRPGDTSPPYHGIGLKAGDRMREDWFPVVWPRRSTGL